MSLAFRAGRFLGQFSRRLGQRLDVKWREARQAFDEGLHGGFTKRRLEQLYARLELRPGADLEAVEKAWRRLVRLYHPDRFANDPDRQSRATEVVTALNDARAELKRYLEERRR